MVAEDVAERDPPNATAEVNNVEYEDKVEEMEDSDVPDDMKAEEGADQVAAVTLINVDEMETALTQEEETAIMELHMEQADFEMEISAQHNEIVEDIKETAVEATQNMTNQYNEIQRVKREHLESSQTLQRRSQELRQRGRLLFDNSERTMHLQDKRVKAVRDLFRREREEIRKKKRDEHYAAIRENSDDHVIFTLVNGKEVKPAV